MTFFLDENIPSNATKYLLNSGHVVSDIRGSEMEGTSDQEIFTLSKKKNAIFLTTDKDFYHTIHLAEKPHHGIIVIALRQPNAKAILEKLSWVLDNRTRFRFENECILLTDSKCTVFK